MTCSLCKDTGKYVGSTLYCECPAGENLLNDLELKHMKQVTI